MGWRGILVRGVRGATRIPAIGDLAARLRFRRRMGYPLRLDCPETYSQHLAASKRLRGMERLAPFVDKWRVRDYVSALIGPEHLVPAVGVFSEHDQLTPAIIAGPVVVKATHASACTWFHHQNGPANSETLADLHGEVRTWLTASYATYNDELNYRRIPRRVVVERMLGDGTGTDLPDYKFFCFHGVPLFIQVDTDRFVGHRRVICDVAWRRLPFSIDGFQSPDPMPVCPAGLADMCRLAARLSAPFPFVRVDLYEHLGRTLFGELTFTPGGGTEPIQPRTWDDAIGGLMDFSATRRFLALLASDPPEASWHAWAERTGEAQAARRAEVEEGWRNVLGRYGLPD